MTDTAAIIATPAAVTQDNCAVARPAPCLPPPLAPRLAAYLPFADGRADVEEFIREAYLEHFDARVSEFMPTLLAMRDANGELRAAAGCRSAAVAPLFLETYTRAPIERVIAARLGITVGREQIVEVGSLACRGGRAAMELVKALVPGLIEMGYTWVVFTGADTIVNVFRRMKLEPFFELCAADKTLLGDAQYDWGSYYEHNPVVMAGRIIDGVPAVGALPRLQ